MAHLQFPTESAVLEGGEENIQFFKCCKCVLSQLKHGLMAFYKLFLQGVWR